MENQRDGLDQNTQMQLPKNGDWHTMTPLAEASRTGQSEMHAMKKKSEPDVVRSFIYWENPPEPGQDLHEIQWGVMEVLSDKSMRFIKTDPDPEELERLIESLKDQML